MFPCKHQNAQNQWEKEQKKGEFQGQSSKCFIALNLSNAIELWKTPLTIVWLWHDYSIRRRRKKKFWNGKSQSIKNLFRSLKEFILMSKSQQIWCQRKESCESQFNDFKLKLYYVLLSPPFLSFMMELYVPYFSTNKQQ